MRPVLDLLLMMAYVHLFKFVIDIYFVQCMHHSKLHIIFSRPIFCLKYLTFLA